MIYATNGAEGISKALHSSPDVALVDIDLPDMQGYEVASRLRKHELTAQIKLIAVTG